MPAIKSDVTPSFTGKRNILERLESLLAILPHKPKMINTMPKQQSSAAVFNKANPILYSSLS